MIPPDLTRDPARPHTWLARVPLLQTWEDTFLAWGLALLQREQIITPPCHSLEHNAYSNYTEYLNEMTVGVTAYLVLDVRQPPPQLYLSNPKAHSRLVRHASGKVLHKYLKYAGNPALAHLYSARAVDSDGLLGLHAYNFHQFRSTCHKPNKMSMSCQMLATYSALHPKLRPVQDACFSISALGKAGSNQYDDRLMEFRNQMIEGRSGLGGELDTKLHTGPQLDVMAHAVHVSFPSRARASASEPWLELFARTIRIIT